MEQVAEWMHQAIKNRRDEKILNSLSIEVKEFCLQFPLPSG
jgi:glycine/serine hydroxymethyltransferase